MRPLHFVLVFLSLIYPLAVHADCPCGYNVNGQLYTHSIYTNFGNILDTKDITDNAKKRLADWAVSEWSTGGTHRTGAGGETLLPKRNSGQNVWIESGMLHLKQNAYSADDLKKKKPVHVAEIVTRRSDILYGSFRSKFRVRTEADSQGGSVVGFFFYDSDKAETDIEILTKEETPTTIHYSQQPTYNYTTDEFYDEATIQVPLNYPWTEMQEHRFDWRPNGTTFYQDGGVISRMTVNTPHTSGKIMFNLWADGGQWSGSPSSQDTYVDIAYLELYFNTSKSHNGQDDDFNSACADAGGNVTCLVGHERDDTEPWDAAGRLEVWRGREWAWGVIGLGMVLAGWIF